MVFHQNLPKLSLEKNYESSNNLLNELCFAVSKMAASSIIKDLVNENYQLKIIKNKLYHRNYNLNIKLQFCRCGVCYLN